MDHRQSFESAGNIPSFGAEFTPIHSKGELVAKSAQFGKMIHRFPDGGLRLRLYGLW
jgi:hypothetical protein